MRIAIVVCGRMGSGKTSVARSLSTRFSLRMVSFGSYVRHKARTGNNGLDRTQLQDLGEEMYLSLGTKGFLKHVLEFSGTNECDSVVFDGVRHADILVEIRKSAATTLAIYLSADDATRYLRLKDRFMGNLEFDEFVAQDFHPVESHVEKLKKQCDLVVDSVQPPSALLKTIFEEVSVIERACAVNRP